MPLNLPGAIMESTSVPSIDFSKLRPAIVPEQARPHVSAPLRLTRQFIAALTWVSVFVFVVSGVVLLTAPSELVYIGFLGRLVIFELGLALVVFAIYRTYRLGRELVAELDEAGMALKGNRAATVSIGSSITHDIVRKTSTSFQGPPDSLETVTPHDVGHDFSGASLQPVSSYGSATTTAETKEDATVPAVSDPRSAVEAVLNEAKDAASDAMEARRYTHAFAYRNAATAVRAAMELSSTWALEKKVIMVLDRVLYVVVCIPIALIGVGELLWAGKLRLHGIELQGLGAVVLVFGPLAWYTTRVEALREMKRAETVVNELNIADVKGLPLSTVQIPELRPLFKLPLISLPEISLQSIRNLNPFSWFISRNRTDAPDALAAV